VIEIGVGTIIKKDNFDIENLIKRTDQFNYIIANPRLVGCHI